MRVALVGCGQISKMHVGAVKQISHAEIVAVCDRDEWRARDLADQIERAHAYADFEKMLREAEPTVVHILTPPHSHAALALSAMEHGCHVLVEKPMTVSVAEADALIDAAQRHNVKVCVNHNYLFKPSVRQALDLVARQKIGQVVYVDSYYGLSGEGNSYGSNLGGGHWAFRLPGGPFTNFLPHLIYLQLAFLGNATLVAGVNCAGENDASPTELTVLLHGAHASGTMNISMRAKPYAKFIDVYGTHGLIHADLVREVTTLHRDLRAPRMVSKVFYNVEDCTQLAAGTGKNIFGVASGKMRNMPELPVLFRAFYQAIENNQEPPAPGLQGKAVMQILEQVWEKMPRRATVESVALPAEIETAPRTRAEKSFAENLPAGKILVTGGTGFLGRHLIEALLRCGADVRVLIRDKSRAPRICERRTELVCGDLRDPPALGNAMRDVSIVFHCAAVTSNSLPWRMHYEANVLGSQAVFDTALHANVAHVIHVSSVVVYGLSANGIKCVDETAQLANATDPWAFYLRSKLEADEIALEYFHTKNLPVTIVRPGVLYGPGGGKTIGKGLLQLGSVTMIPGSGKNCLPYTYVANAVDALLLAAVTPAAIGQVYNIVDEPQMSVREWMSQNENAMHEKTLVLPVPQFLLLGAATLAEHRVPSNGHTAPPKLSHYVIRSACRDLQYDTSKAQRELGWTPEVNAREGLARMAQEAA